MNKAELLADLQAKCVWVGTMQRQQGSDRAPLPEAWTVPVVEIASEGAYSAPRAFRFTVLNEGVIPGPVFYDADIFDESDPPVLLHAAGDPVLDENGNQIVIPEQDGERVLIHGQIKTPLADTMQALTFLEGQRGQGRWLRYVEDDAGPKRPDLGFFIVRAWVETAGNKVAEKRFMVGKDAQGASFAKEIE